MTIPIEGIRPRLAAGCRLAMNGNNTVMLFPEGALRLEGPSHQILERCDGQRTFEEIIVALRHLYVDSDATQIREDVAGFLEQMKDQRIVDY
jgi:pyrroloquinoline quinone biosynthesis protein D